MGNKQKKVQTDFNQLDAGLVAVIADADKVNHVVVFLTGQAPLPEGTAALIYFCWPDPNGPPNWQLLGYISNEKPSAVFQISGLKKTRDACVGIGCTGCGDPHCCSAAQGGWFPQFGLQPTVKHAQVGISVTSLDVVMQQVATLESTNVTANPRPVFVEFTEKMLENFMNYASSFAVTQAQMVPNPAESYVTLNVLLNWYNNFQRRLSLNPYFWKT